MSCSNPFYKWNVYTKSWSRIPCGWCMACRVDRRTYFQDRFEYDLYKKFDGVGTFGCITYDDFHLPSNNFGDMWSLSKSDVQKFWKRVRAYISYHKINNALIRKDFKHFTVGEYSPTDFRPHYHFIAVGLDFAAALPIFEKCWKNAVIFDSRPILRGGMSYVLKYIDKQRHKEQLEDYIDNGLEPPFMISSHSVGNGLYSSENVDFKNQTYKWNGFNRPLPPRVKAFFNMLPRPFSLKDDVKYFAEKTGMAYYEADKYIRAARERRLEHRSWRELRPVEPVGVFSDTNPLLELPNYRSI